MVLTLKLAQGTVTDEDREDRIEAANRETEAVIDGAANVMKDVSDIVQKATDKMDKLLAALEKQAKLQEALAASR
jgi:hypothetical protein